MSGGLDSTYAAYWLKAHGHDVEGATLRMHQYTDITAAEEAAATVGIKLHVIDCTEAFEKHVVSNFVSEYAAGRTPNPCVMCNRHVKIAKLCDFASANGFDCVSTGHYTEIDYDSRSGRYFVCRAHDSNKDQSYVLWQLTQEQLALLYTPLFGMKKDDIRKTARELSFSAADKKESQENCFIPDNDYAGFIISRLGRERFPEGDFIDTAGNRVGTHRGIIHYTVGQRKKLGLALGEPVFVSAIDPINNTVTVSKSGGEYTDRMNVSKLNFQFLTPTSDAKFEAEVKIRYGASAVKASVEIHGDTASIYFDQPARAVTPGQSAVFYSEDRILFGGFIN